MPASKKYQVSVNLRLSQATYDAYKSAAEVMGTDTTGAIRQIVDEGVRYVEVLAQAHDSAKAGNILTAVNLLTATMDSVVAQGEEGRQHMHAVREEIEGKEAARSRAKSA